MLCGGVACEVLLRITGLETGARNHVSIVLQQGRALVALTSGLRPVHVKNFILNLQAPIWDIYAAEFCFIPNNLQGCM